MYKVGFSSSFSSRKHICYHSEEITLIEHAWYLVIETEYLTHFSLVSCL